METVLELLVLLIVVIHWLPFKLVIKIIIVVVVISNSINLVIIIRLSYTLSLV